MGKGIVSGNQDRLSNGRQESRLNIHGSSWTRSKILTILPGLYQNHNAVPRIELRSEYYVHSNQVRNFESPGTWLLHAN